MKLISVGAYDKDIHWLKELTNYINEQNDIFVAWSASVSQSVLTLSECTPVNIVLFGTQMNGPDDETIQLINRLSAKRGVKVIALTGTTVDEQIIQLFRAGAIDSIYKANLREIPNKIRFALNHSFSFEVILKDYQKLVMEKKLQALTYTEKKIVLELKNGYSKEMICEKLCIALTTYKKHISNIIDKFQVKNVKEVLNHINRMV